MISGETRKKNPFLKSIPTSSINLITEYFLSGGLKFGDKLLTEAEFSQHLGVRRTFMSQGNESAVPLRIDFVGAKIISDAGIG